jgi:hypothetical protein
LGHLALSITQQNIFIIIFFVLLLFYLFYGWMDGWILSFINGFYDFTIQQLGYVIFYVLFFLECDFL